MKIEGFLKIIWLLISSPVGQLAGLILAGLLILKIGMSIYFWYQDKYHPITDEELLFPEKGFSRANVLNRHPHLLKNVVDGEDEDQ